VPRRPSSPAPPWADGRREPLLKSLGLEPFRQAFPWYGPELQTVRDTIVPPPPLPPGAESLLIDLADGGQLLARLNRPTVPGGARALVLLVHGLGGDSESPALARLTRLLLASRLAVLRLNLRGAGAGRGLAPGCYSAVCGSDLRPVLALARRLTRQLAHGTGSPVPLFGVGHSLGGTILLNLCLSDGGEHRACRQTGAESPGPESLGRQPVEREPSGREPAAPAAAGQELAARQPGHSGITGARLQPSSAASASNTRQARGGDGPAAATASRALDGLVCLSSPLDLEACSRRLGAARNALSHAWLLRRLIRQVLADPQPLPAAELEALQGPGAVRSLRQFDHRITARRWGFASVEAYYRSASPLPKLLAGAALPPTLVLQSRDDPWIPSEAIETWLRRNPAAGPSLLLTARGGHGGFHGAGSVLGRQQGSWAEQLAVRWLLAQSRTDRAGG
jgi:predicted alpha/beta-fold hydrolase